MFELKSRRSILASAAVLLGILLSAAVTTAHADTLAWESTDATAPDVVVCVESVNVNTATAEQLQVLWRIGPVLSGRIIDGRPYEVPEDLLDVKGIGPKTLAANLHYLATSGETTLTTDVPSPEDTEGEPTSWRQLEECPEDV